MVELIIPAPDLVALREEWSLAHVIQPPENAVVVIAGAYKGKLMEYMATFHHCKAVYGFEPQDWAYATAIERLGDNWPTCHMLPYGIAIEDNLDLDMGEWGTDGCSILADTRERGTGHFKEAIAEFTKIIAAEERAIDLAIFNMEGYEFILLDYLLDHEHIASMVRKFAIQFHTQYATPAMFGKVLGKLDHVYRYRFNYFLASWGYWSDTKV